MRITTTPGSGRLDGRFDAHTAPTARAALHAAGAEARNIRLDLAEVDFIDSSGLAVLVAAHKERRAEGGALVIVAISQAVRIILELTGLDVVLLTEVPA